MRRICFIVLLLPVFFFSCSEAENKIPDYAGLKYDSTRIKIFTFDKSNALTPDDASAVELSQADLQLTESLFKDCLTDYNKKTIDKLKTLFKLGKQPEKAPEDFLLNPADYTMQYIPYRDHNAQRIMLVNCFCSKEETWRRKVVVKEGGGKCYFRVTLNLSRSQYNDLRINPVDPEN